MRHIFELFRFYFFFQIIIIVLNWIIIVKTPIFSQTRIYGHVCAQIHGLHIPRGQRLFSSTHCSSTHVRMVAVHHGVHSGLLRFPQRGHHGKPAGLGAQVCGLRVRRHEHGGRASRLCRSLICRIHSGDNQELGNCIQSDGNTLLFWLHCLFHIRNGQKNCLNVLFVETSVRMQTRFQMSCIPVLLVYDFDSIKMSLNEFV